MIMSKAIQDNNLLYNILSPLVQFATRCHYNHFVVIGKENLPTDGPYIIAPCHQQALMEPLAVLCFAPKPPVFLARADIFAKPTLRAILTFLKIMPVYRIRDGQDKLGRNQEIFDRCRNVLLDGYPLCLMAEGRHNNRHRLLPLRKGMFRIAGETQLKLGERPLYIVPTGIDFDEYERPYSNLVVNIGKSIPVQPFMADYRTDEPVALNRMREALTEALPPLMHDIRDEEHYNEIMTLCNVLNKRMRLGEKRVNSAWNRFLMRQKIAQKMDALSVEGDSQKYASLIDGAHSISCQCQRLHLDEKLVSDHWSLPATLLSLLAVTALATSIALVPSFRWLLLFCLLCYPIPLMPTHLIAKKTIADPQFRSSVNFGIRLVISILYAIAIFIVAISGGLDWLAIRLSHSISHIPLSTAHLIMGILAIVMLHLEARIAAPAINYIKGIYHNCRYWAMRIVRRNGMRKIDETLSALTSNTTLR